MPPALVNHIGLTVPDVFAAIDWYCDVLGFRLIMGPRVLEPRGTSPEARQIFGERFAKAYQAHLLADDGVGLELFEFVEPAVEPAEPSMRYERPGFFHICVTVEDVAATIERIEAAGGTRMSGAAAFVPGRPWRNSYCRDPWGNPIELISGSYAEVFSDWPQPGMERETRILNRDRTESTLPARPS